MNRTELEIVNVARKVAHLETIASDLQFRMKSLGLEKHPLHEEIERLKNVLAETNLDTLRAHRE